MKANRKWKWAVSVVFCLIWGIPFAQAGEPIDITYCLSLTITMVSETQELSINSFDFKGIARSNLENKTFDNLTFHGIGVGRDLADKKRHAYGYIKFMDPDGTSSSRRTSAPWMPGRTPIGISCRALGNGRGSRAEANFALPRGVDP